MLPILSPYGVPPGFRITGHKAPDCFAYMVIKSNYGHVDLISIGNAGRTGISTIKTLALGSVSRNVAEKQTVQ